ncbi:MAG: TetR family transcriptional regulator [Polyangiaceae bacterium]
MKAHTKARNAEDKAERRAELLRAAAALFDTVPYAKITMAEVAERAGLSKGTVYLYFESKEELFLALLEDLLFAWYDAFDRRIDAARGELSADELLRIFAEVSLGQGPTLSRLIAIVSGVLEHNVGFEAAASYKRRLWTQMTRTGAKLEARGPYFRPGEGFQFLGHLALFIVGARQLADLAPMIVRVIDEFDLKGFRFDFDSELYALVQNHLRGLENRPDVARSATTTAKRRARRGSAGGTGRRDRA